MANKLVKVLLVEDEEISQFAAKTVLEALGCEVDLANTGYSALEMVKNNFYDLVFMDLGIFDMDGFNVTKEIRKMDGANKTVPIVALTGYDQKSTKNKALKIGLNDYVVKPLNMENCKNILMKFIKK
jgi:two-component system, OmpR family, aerobic respiration control sensor histidine kinase ArcB